MKAFGFGFLGFGVGGGVGFGGSHHGMDEYTGIKYTLIGYAG